MLNRQVNLASPIKWSNTTPNLRAKAQELLRDGDDEQPDSDDDEETLQLKLAAIEARLKLKKLQQNKAKAAASTSDVERPGSAVSSSVRPASRLRHATDRRGSVDEVQVPLSPAKRIPAVAEPVSPRRVLLGIDKGLKGKDVSLRRPPASTRLGSSLGPRDRSTPLTGDRYESRDIRSSAGEGIRRTKSFSERIAESRSAEKARQERAEKIQKSRSTAFQVDKAEIEHFKQVAAAQRPSTSPVRPQVTESFSREDVLRAFRGSSPALRKTKTTPNLRDLAQTQKSGGELLGPETKSSSEGQTNTGEEGPDPSKYEPFSALHLSNRILPHSFLSRTLESKTILRIPDLLKAVKAPNFDPPDVDGDYVVFGIVASKSAPKEHKESKKATTKEVDPYDDGLNNTDKYMAITLTDLKWTIDLFLFDTAFPRYYKLSEGILIAILNPNILPPPPNKIDTNRFSLCISSSDDTVLEIGSARDIGFCKAVRKDGKTCQAWVDARKTEFCDFHVDAQIRRTQAQRMGVNGGTGMFGPGGRSGPRTGFFGGGVKQSGGIRRGLKPDGAQYDRETQSTFYVAPAPKVSNLGNPSSGLFSRGHRTASASSLLDGDDDPFLPAGMNGRGAENREERLRRRLAEQQRERDIASKLGAKKGGGIGAEYLRTRVAENFSSPSPHVGGGDASTPSEKDKSASSSAANGVLSSLGLGPGSARKADTIRLSPMKRAHEGDKFRGSAVKKTRFITSKGIREAGRDSLGGTTTSLSIMNNNNNENYNDDDDDDELDIIA
ncbi:hypothetical protein VTN77DRAFT_149 [Rasamsonia byssochlamydoides]|uniref:uncharacterized protein n=1 Tax=Rasamsonia byssochlamydoides TaxID=89139 RepID=UPI003742A6D8